MLVKKILNNNAIIAATPFGEVVMLGCGIGYQVRGGEEIAVQKIEKWFSRQHLNNFEDYAICCIVVNQMITATKGLGIRSSQMLAERLTSTLERIILSEGQAHPLAPVIYQHLQENYPQILQIGQMGLRLLSNNLKCDVAIHEAGLIALELLNEYGDKRYG
ncbi:CAT RNA binding domain-containing protein [Weissella kandleri]|uniref:CAT RNA binding domain-containing protein n=1 Tax=Weissella kandleri TaxID=1616 RepID=UPI00387E42D4